MANGSIPGNGGIVIWLLKRKNELKMCIVTLVRKSLYGFRTCFDMGNKTGAVPFTINLFFGGCMKNAMTKAGMILTLTALLALSGCPSSDEGSSEALLSDITLREISPGIPDPFPKAQWNDEYGFFDIFDPAYSKTVYFNNSVDMVGVPISAKASSGASVAYGLMTGGDRPAAFSSVSTMTFAASQALIVRVTSEDGGTVNYYRFVMMLQSTDSNLSSLTVAGVTATIGNPGNNWNTVSNPGTVGLSNKLKNDAQVAGIPSSENATVEYGVALGIGVEPAFSDTDVLNFTDGNMLYIRVTAEDGITRSFYRIEVQIGRDATLQSVVLGETEVQVLGTPRPAWGNGTWTSSQRGSYQADERQPAGGFDIAVTTKDQEAEAHWTWINTSIIAEPSNFAQDAQVEFPPDSSDLIIRVTAANGSLNYYRIRIITKSYATVNYGTPSLGAVGSQTIDPIWDAEEWLDVSRFNRAESWAAFFESSPHTTARAKALWDDDGFWAYWDIDFMNYTDGNGVAQTRAVTPSGTPVTAGNVPDGAHERDSIELFINERFQAQKTGNYGSQYRVGADNVWLSGAAGNTPTNVNPITIFQQSGMTRAWSKPGNAGYVVVMRVPWIYKDNPQANAVFDSAGKVKSGAQIGIELQVNACAERAGVIARDAILTWNGVTSQAYQNVRSFGIVELIR